MSSCGAVLPFTQNRERQMAGMQHRLSAESGHCARRSGLTRFFRVDGFEQENSAVVEFRQSRFNARFGQQRSAERSAVESEPGLFDIQFADPVCRLRVETAKPEFRPQAPPLILQTVGEENGPLFVFRDVQHGVAARTVVGCSDPVEVPLQNDLPVVLVGGDCLPGELLLPSSICCGCSSMPRRPAHAMSKRNFNGVRLPVWWLGTAETCAPMTEAG